MTKQPLIIRLLTSCREVRKVHLAQGRRPLCSQMEPAKSKRPKDTAFRQQNMKAWRPVLTPRLVILLFLVVGCVFVPVGVAVLIASDSVIEIEGIDYGSACCIQDCDGASGLARVDRNPCYVNITVPEKMEPPIFMYYKLTNFYQNHRRYVKSRSDQQLRGLDVDEDALNTSCQHRVVAEGYNVSAPENQRIISPCGLIAWSMFNDSFTLLHPTGEEVTGVSFKNIAWESDVNIKFKNAKPDVAVKSGANFPHFYHERQQPCSSFPDSNKFEECERGGAGWCFHGSGYCVEDEHFIVWMRTAGLPTFRKLYARIDTELAAGTYTVRIHNGQRFNVGAYDYFFNPSESAAYYADPSVLPRNQTTLYPVHTFGGTKAVVLSTSSWVGGKNDFLGTAYLVVGIICLILAVGFAVKQKYSPR